jgi:hypothetical protein
VFLAPTSRYCQSGDSEFFFEPLELFCAGRAEIEVTLKSEINRETSVADFILVAVGMIEYARRVNMVCNKKELSKTPNV